jgi:hypothetical protein
LAEAMSPGWGRQIDIRAKPASGGFMFRRYAALSLGFFMPFHQVDQEVYRIPLQEQIERPYSALLELMDPEYSGDELRSLSSRIQRERDRQIEACRQEESRLADELDAARKKLKSINKSSSRDTLPTARQRTDIHTEIAAIEHALQSKKMERENLIPAAFEIKLSKLRLVERWPERREEVSRKIKEGRARERKHGDIEDIGYRKIVDDQKKDIPIGEQAVREMAFRLRELQAAEVQQYVRDLASSIAENSDLKIPLHVTVLDSPDIHAIGFPGGFLFVSSGLIRATGTESELAGVIAHEIARIAARHGTRSSKRSVISKLFVPAAQVTTGLFTGGITNAGAYYGMNYGIQGLGMLADRALTGAGGKYEREADQLGIQYLWKAGFDPKGFITFLDSIAKDRQYSKSAGFFRTKPTLGERLVDAFSEIQYLPSAANQTVDSVKFQKAKELLENYR